MILGRHRIPVLWGLGLLVVIAALGSATIGAMEIGLGDVLAMCVEALGGAVAPVDDAARSVLWKIRTPRIALGLLIGATLGLAGATLQGIFRNPLADPGLIGVSSGAALCVVGVIVFGAMLSLPTSPYLIPAAAFAGALTATGCVLRLSMRHGRIDVATMLLAGVAINALAGALIGFATYVADDAQLRSLTMWSLGSLSGATGQQVAIIAALAIPGAAVIMRHATSLDLLLLGEREAAHLGVDVTKTRRTLVVTSALIVGIGVGWTGVIGFVGLVIPHLLRLLGGSPHRWVLPGSALGGAALVVLADTLARTVAAPAEIPIGVLTSLVGAPFFLGLLVRHTRTHGGW